MTPEERLATIVTGLEAVGLTCLVSEDEEGGSPVDREALQALVDKKLPEVEARQLSHLTLAQTRPTPVANGDASLLRCSRRQDMPGCCSRVGTPST